MVRVAFIHPDLGIGGAERLIVDAALALKSNGHHIEMFTAHHDKNHCFSETSDGTLKVTCVGDWLPRSCCNKGYALWAYIRMVVVALYLVSKMLFGDRKFDVIICDQVSACIPVLHLSRAKVLFYCHFPDLLQTDRKHWLKKVYRWPIDKWEEWTTGLAHQVLVNSNFTAGVFHRTFKSLSSIKPTVLHPSLNFSAFDQPPVELKDTLPNSVKCLFLSINRYERKKNLRLAIEAFAETLKSVDPSERSTVHLAMAGGYDERVVENKAHYLELRLVAKSLQINDNVTFIRSFTDQEKVALLDRCHALIYTPSNEHFGICPLEGMYLRRPVVAVNSGGPLETVVDGKTGFLCEPTAEAFGDKMVYLYENPEKSVEMGQTGREHVIANFSFEAFTRKLNDIVEGLCQKQ